MPYNGNGMTVSEMVNYLLLYDIYNLLNLDGGGSTTLAMEDPVTHVDRIVNSVSTPRFVGSSLAIFANPIPEPATLILVFSGSAFVAAIRLRQRRRRSQG